jgi:hypothetical protein
MDSVSFEVTQRVVVFHFGLGNELDRSFLRLTNPHNLSKAIEIIPGHSYCLLEFANVQHSAAYLQTKQKLQDKPVYYE